MAASVLRCRIFGPLNGNELLEAIERLPPVGNAAVEHRQQLLKVLTVAQNVEVLVPLHVDDVSVPGGDSFPEPIHGPFGLRGDARGGLAGSLGRAEDGRGHGPVTGGIVKVAGVGKVQSLPHLGRRPAARSVLALREMAEAKVDQAEAEARVAIHAAKAFVNNRYGLRTAIAANQAQCQVVHSPKCAGVVGSEPGLLKRQYFLAEPEGLGVAAEGEVTVGEVSHARERVGVIGAKLGFPPCNRFLVERDGLAVKAAAAIDGGQITHGRDCAGVIGAELDLLRRESLFPQLQ